MPIFAIRTAADLLAKAEEDLEGLVEQMDHSGRAMNCILSAHHLHEWVWALHLKAEQPIALPGKTIRAKSDLVEWLDDHCPHFRLIQELANGSKHCSPVHGTDKIDGYGRGPYGVGPYGRSYLLIDLGEDRQPADRWLVAHLMLKEVLAFWRQFCEAQGIGRSA
jgi:hypothetical protein